MTEAIRLTARESCLSQCELWRTYIMCSWIYVPHMCICRTFFFRSDNVEKRINLSPCLHYLGDADLSATLASTHERQGSLRMTLDEANPVLL